MVEWFKAAVLKTAVAVMSPRVRIPLSPPVTYNNSKPVFPMRLHTVFSNAGFMLFVMLNLDKHIFPCRSLSR